MEVNAGEARNRLGALLDQVEQGDEIVLLRRGKRIARLVPEGCPPKRLPSLREFRASLKLKGKPLSEVVRMVRDEERY